MTLLVNAIGWLSGILAAAFVFLFGYMTYHQIHKGYFVLVIGLGYFILLNFVIKTLAVVQSMCWLNTYGNQFRDKHGAAILKGKISDQTLWNFYSDTNGAYILFGIRDHLVHRFLNFLLGVSSTLWSRGTVEKIASVAIYLARLLISIWKSIFFRYLSLSVVSFVYLSTVSILIALDSSLLVSYSLYYIKHLLYLISAVALFCNVLLAVETIFCYSTLRSYAILFHHLRTSKSELGKGNELLLELRSIFMKVGAYITHATISCFICILLFKGYGGANIELLQKITPAWRMLARTFLASLYYVITTMATIGYGDIVPSNGYGQVITILIELQTVLVVTVIFAIFFSVVPNTIENDLSSINENKDIEEKSWRENELTE